MKGRLFACCIALLLTLPLFRGELGAQEALVPAGGKEVFIELFRLELTGLDAMNYIGGHYTYYFTDWLAAGPGLSIPPLDWSFFNLGVFAHAYLFPLPSWFVRPFLYLEAGAIFTDMEWTFTMLGMDRPGSFWYWTGFLRPGVGMEVQIYRSDSFLVTGRIMLYQHLEFLLMQYFMKPMSGLNLSFGVSWAFF